MEEATGNSFSQCRFEGEEDPGKKRLNQSRNLCSNNASSGTQFTCSLYVSHVGDFQDRNHEVQGRYYYR